MTGRGWSLVAWCPLVRQSPLGASRLGGVCWVLPGWVGWSWCAVLGL